MEAKRILIRPQGALVEKKTPQKLDNNGYWRVDGRLVHRQVWAEVYGAPPKGWVVHHCDGIKTNNDINNLVALPAKYHDEMHARVHKLGQPLPPREYLMGVSAQLKKELEDLIEKWRGLYSECKRVEEKIKQIGEVPGQRAPKNDRIKALKKKSRRK